VTNDTFDNVVAGLVKAINSSNNGQGDPNVLATPNIATQSLVLTSRIPGADGNNITLATTLSTSAVIVATTSGATLSGGQDAAKIAPGTIVAVLGDGLSERTESARADQQELPTTLADTQVYFDGIRAPLLMVSPTEIDAQVPFEVVDRTSINAYVRTKRQDGSIVVTTPVAVTIVPQNPGIFALPGSDPRQAIVMHGSASASGTVSVDGSVTAGDVGTVIIEDREYSYTVTADDTLATVRDHLIDAINQDPKVRAFAAGSFTRIRLRARTPGVEGNGIQFSAKSNDGATLILTPLNVALCCANSGMVTSDNPAVGGETIIIYATGLGIPIPRVEATGIRYNGPIIDPNSFVSSLAGGKTANVLLATFQTGQVGIYEVDLELNSDMATDPLAQLTIAQDIYVSNIVTFPVVNPTPP
jgi:phage tail sheath gpL-like